MYRRQTRGMRWLAVDSSEEGEVSWVSSAEILAVAVVLAMVVDVATDFLYFQHTEEEYEQHHCDQRRGCKCA